MVITIRSKHIVDILFQILDFFWCRELELIEALPGKFCCLAEGEEPGSVFVLEQMPGNAHQLRKLTTENGTLRWCQESVILSFLSGGGANRKLSKPRWDNFLFPAAIFRQIRSNQRKS